MNASAISKIEDSFNQLSLTEQLRLIERLVQRVRENMAGDETTFEVQLTAMAADPEIQSKLQQIEAEFVLTEADGLELV